jgi:hypothetical protein
LRGSGFAEPEYAYGDTWDLRKRVQISGNWYDVTIQERDNSEIPEIYISFYKTE